MVSESFGSRNISREIILRPLPTPGLNRMDAKRKGKRTGERGTLPISIELFFKASTEKVIFWPMDLIVTDDVLLTQWCP